MKQNRKEILKTIFKLFLTRHYEDVSYDDMIKATNISKGGLYHYAPNKIELFRLVHIAKKRYRFPTIYAIFNYREE